MPPGKRRKVSQDENSVRDGVGSRLTPSDEKAGQDDGGSPPSAEPEKRVRQPAKNDTTDVAVDEGKPVVPPTGKRSSTRVVKKIRRDVSPQGSPVKKPPPATPKEAAGKTGTPEAKTKRQWESWQEEDIKNFFDALFEFGKDFDSIQNVVAQRCKKRGVHSSLIKNKDQVRFFYYRTIHKINKFIETTNDVKKDTQELYALINYGILRDNIKCLNEKTAQKLRELIHNGVTCVRFKGKNRRIKTPACSALKKLNNIGEHKEEPAAQTVPEKITIELAPKSNKAWSHVQSVAQNPRLKMKLAGDRSIGAVVRYLTKKWKERRVQLKESLNQTDEMKILTVYPHTNSKVNPVIVTRYTVPKVDVTFASYKENIMGSPNTTGSKSSKKSSSVEEVPKPSSDNSSESEAVSTSPPKLAKMDPSIPVDKSDSSKSVCPTPEISMLMGDDNAMFPDRPLFYEEDSFAINRPSTSTSTLLNSDMSSDIALNPENNVCDNANHGVNPSGDGVEVQGESTDSQDSTDELMKEMVEKAKLGWTEESGKTVTLAQVYLMCGVEGVVKLEYDWCDNRTMLESPFVSKLTNMLRRLAHIATVEFVDPTRIKLMSESTAKKPVLCTQCGAVAERSRSKSANAKSRSNRDKCSGRRTDDADEDEEVLAPVSTATLTCLTTSATRTSTVLTPGKSQIITNTGDGVFRVPVGVPLVRYPQAGVNQVMQSLQQKQSNLLMPKRKRMVRQKPLIVQRTLLPKAPSGQIVTILPSNVISPQALSQSPQTMSQRPQALSQSPQTLSQSPQALNQSPQSLSQSPQALSQSPQALRPQTFSPASLTNRPTGGQIFTSQTLNSLGTGVNDKSPLLSQTASPSPQNKTVPRPLNIASEQASQMSTSQPINVPLTVNTDIAAATPGLLIGTSSASDVAVSAASGQSGASRSSDLSISPPNLSSLLGMSLTCPPAGNVMADKILEMATLVNSNSSFSGLLDAASLKCGSGDAPASSFRPMDESSRLITPPHSPSHIGAGADTQWLNGEVGDMSLTSFLISPAKKSDSSQATSSSTVHFPSSIFSENSQESIVAKLDVDQTLQVMMNENSMDYVAKFESLAAHIDGCAPSRHKDSKT